MAGTNPEVDNTSEPLMTGTHTEQRSNSLAKIRETYADQADMLARMDWLNWLLTGRYRRWLFQSATGHVLDVACGMGTNVEYLPIRASTSG